MSDDAVWLEEKGNGREKYCKLPLTYVTTDKRMSNFNISMLFLIKESK